MSLAKRNTLLLTLALFFVELVVAAALVKYLLLPVAQGSADDLASLMVLSAQTWSELPDDKQRAFEKELIEHHAIALRVEPLANPTSSWRPPYFTFLEQALAARIGHAPSFLADTTNHQTWYWASIPSKHQTIYVGIPKERIGIQPLSAIIVLLLIGLLVAVLLAHLLAKSITLPLAKLDLAAQQLGQGEYRELHPNAWPKELRELADRFNTMARQVQRLLTARTTILAGISHDLRTPLARMRLALELLKESPTPKLITRLETDINEMNQLIGTILDLARGLDKEHLSRINVYQLLTELIEQSEAHECISVDCSPNIEISLPALSLRRALSNLIENALRYAPIGKINLVCKYDEKICRIGVLDQGPGIPPEKIESVFLPFERIEGSRSSSTGGAGLGLAIVRELANIHGWHVKLEPRNGGGIAAWIEIFPKPKTF